MPVNRIQRLSLASWREGGLETREDAVAVEEPLEIRLDGEDLSVLMRTPGHDVELALGLLRAEEIIESADDVALVEHCRDGTDPEKSNVVNVTLEPARARRDEVREAKQRAERTFMSSTSCGVCGKRNIASLHATAPPFETLAPIDLGALTALPARMRAAQEVFEETGALHAAAIFEGDRLVVLREDVGRHNAVDKCVGQMLMREHAPGPSTVLVLSGRASFEMVQKALVARIPTVIAVSAPSSLAVELARASRMRLCGFVRGPSLNLYSPAPG